MGDAAWLVAAGFGAGVVNGVAGGGSLVSFPALLALGYPAVTANVTSAVGILPGYAGGVAGFRRALVGQGPLLRSLAVVVVPGAVVGAALLLALPSESFRLVVPYLLLGACALFAAQPSLARRLRSAPGTTRGHVVARQVGTFLAAVYGAYFGAGLGVILLAVLGLTVADTLVRINGARSVATLACNVVAVAVFVVLAPVDWGAAAVMAAASLVGGYAGAHLAQRIPVGLLRALVVVVGVAAAVRLLVA